MEHLNLGSFSKHFLCPSTEQFSEGKLALISAMTMPNENISEANDGGWPRIISGAMCQYFLRYSSCSCALRHFVLKTAPDTLMDLPKSVSMG